MRQVLREHNINSDGMATQRRYSVNGTLLREIIQKPDGWLNREHNRFGGLRRERYRAPGAVFKREYDVHRSLLSTTMRLPKHWSRLHKKLLKTPVRCA